MSNLFEKQIDQCKDIINTLTKDLSLIKNIASSATADLIKQEVRRQEFKIKELELQIKYIDYQ
jgi:hypothetical protein